MRKKIVVLLLALCMIFGMTATAFAAENGLSALSMEGKTVILHTNDVHGAIEGYAYLAKLKADYEALGAEVILADAGDFSQGTTYVSSDKGETAVEMMNAVSYDVVTLGNHEFDYSVGQLKENLSKAEFKVVCANVLENDKPLFDPYTVLTMKSGLKVAFVGIETPEAYTKVNPAFIRGLTILTTTLFEEVQKQIDAARKEADIVVVLSHLGIDDSSKPYRSIDFAANVNGYDFIIDAHSHIEMTEGPNGEKIQSAGSSFAKVGEIVIDNETKKIESNKIFDVKTGEADAEIAAMAQQIIDAVQAEYSMVFAKSEVSLVGAKSFTDGVYGNRDGETNNGDFVADAMLWTAAKDGGITVDADHIAAVINGGAIRAAIEPGDVTKNDINSVLPFKNTVTVVYVTGAELLEALEASTYFLPVGGFPQVSGMEYTIYTDVNYDPNAESYPNSTYYGPASVRRVQAVSINGKPLALDEVYAVVTNDFCSGGGDTYYAFTVASGKFDTGITLDEAVMDYVNTELGGVIGKEYAEPQGRIHVISPLAALDKNAWYSNAVSYAVNEGYAYGKPEGFCPADVISKAEVVTMLWRLEGEPYVNYFMQFKDVESEEWYTEAVRWAAAEKIANGYGDGHFGPADEITREQLAVILYRYAQKKGEGFTGDWMFLLPCTDRADISEWANEAVHWCYMQGITEGKDGNVFDPQGNASRAEAAAMMMRFCESLEK